MCVQLEKKVITISAKNVKMLEKTIAQWNKLNRTEQIKNCSSKKEIIEQCQ